MNKGFYSIIIAAIAIVVLVITGFQSVNYESINEKSSINIALAAQTKNALEDMLYAFDKSVTNAIKENFNSESCSVSNTETKIKSNFDAITASINSSFNVECMYSNLTVSQNNNSVKATLTLKCIKSLNDNNNTVFSIELRKENVEIEKTYSINPPIPPCSLTVRDWQGRYTEWP